MKTFKVSEKTLGITATSSVTEVPVNFRGISLVLQEFVNQRLASVKPGQYLRIDFDNAPKARARRASLLKLGYTCITRQNSVYIAK